MVKIDFKTILAKIWHVVKSVFRWFWAKGKPVYVMCQSGIRSYIATRILEGNGFEAYNFAGGFRFYDAVRNDQALIEAATACGMDQLK